MSRQYLLTGVMFIVTYSASICAELCTDVAFTLVEKNTTSADSVLGTSTVAQRAECIVLCLKNISCVSVEYNNSSGKCLTHDIEVIHQTGKKYEQGTDIYQITEKRPLPCVDKGYTFSSLGNFCYRVYGKQNKERWNDARTICQSKGGELVKLDTQIKKDAMIDTENKKYYIGAKDVYQNGTWIWVIDNSTVNDFSKTDNNGNKICLLFDFNNNEYKTSKCNNGKERFICEIVLN